MSKGGSGTGVPRGNGMPKGLFNHAKHGSVKPIDINKFQGKTLEQVEKRLRNLKSEQMFFFDANGNIIAGYRGNNNSVSFPASMLDNAGATVTHGHPKGYENFGGTFSFADVENMASSNWAEHRATASGQGEMNYIIRRTKNSDGAGLMRQINKDVSSVESRYVKEYNKQYYKSMNEGKGYQVSAHEARQVGTGIINRYWKDTLPKYGFQFITRKKDYRYGR